MTLRTLQYPAERLYSSQCRTIVPFSEGLIYARNWTKYTLTGWILKTALLLSSPFHRGGTWTSESYRDLFKVMYQGFTSSSGCLCTVARPVIPQFPLPWALVPGVCQMRWLGAPHFIRSPGFESWSLCFWWTSYFTPLNLNFLYQMGIIIVITS